ncbi:GAS2-like protein 2 [Microcaecilia unicolor]|uniref:GAS2-like protein 2 n=1 Tax=Microcaecilia unicolor TaxID=1415580 RepID=A0A6P7WED4_9AMPH|nr:GAS2-like protein 2 [Microcaecilia unicolor]
MSGIQEATVKSIRPFKSSEQYLFAMKEDLAEWLNDLYDLQITVDSFLEALETGTVLCQHATNVTLVAQEFSSKYPMLAQKVQLPKSGVTFNCAAQPGTFQARDNVSNFIYWCRREMDIKDVLMFETEDLVLRKNEKNFILCLLELARRASRFGMSAPILIQMEEEIEEEIREEMDLPPPEIPIPKPSKPDRKFCDFKNLDQMVQYLVSCCTCPVHFSMVKVSEGKYRVGDSSTLIFVRILRNHVMVRVGGGWDTLEHYLDKHDPCRCTSLSHKQALKSGSGPKQAAPVHEIKARLMPREDHPNKPQATLIVSRSQSPLPPVEWRTYTPGSPNLKATPSSPERSGRTQGSRNLQRQTDPRRANPARGSECFSAVPQRQLLGDERTASQQITSRRNSQDSSCVSVSSLTSHLTGSEEETDISFESPCRMEKERIPVHPRKKEVVVKDNRLIQTPMAQVTILRDSAQVVPKLSAQKSHKLQESRAQGAASPIKQFYSSLQPSSKGAVQSLKTKPCGVTRSIQNPEIVHTSSPVKQFLPKAENQMKITVKSVPAVSRPPTPSRNSYNSESQAINGNKVLDGDSVKVTAHQKLKTTQSVDVFQDQREYLSVKQERSPSTIQSNTNRLNLPKQGHNTEWSNPAWETESENGNGNSSIESFSDRECTPLLINPEQEKQLYRSLEDEILSNIKVLKGDSEESNNLENEPGDSTSEHSTLSNTETHNYSTLEVSKSSGSLFPVSLKSLGEGVPRSGVYINTKWQTETGYDDVVAELSKGHRKLNKVDVESWIAKVPPKERVKVRQESNNSLPNNIKTKKEPLEMERVYSKRKTVTCESKVFLRPRRLPSQRAYRASTEVNKNVVTSHTISDEQKAFHLPPDQAGTLEGFKPKRCLKKPERVPSIYKLKLRPRIRPRKDNRPEKQPSRIPTPVTYRQLKKTVKTKGLERKRSSCTSKQQARTLPGAKHRQTILNNAGHVEDTESEEDISTHVRNSGRVEEEGKSSWKAEEDEESWV